MASGEGVANARAPVVCAVDAAPPGLVSEVASGVKADMAIEVVVGLEPGDVWHSALHLPAGAAVADALRAAGVLVRVGAAVLDGLHLSVWGRACAPDMALRAHDRVELTRGLEVDPKEARRLRYRRDGLRKPQRPRKAKALIDP